MLSDVTTPQDLDDRFREALAGLAAAPRRRDPAERVHDGAPLTGAQLLDLFDAQVTSRQLDLAGRWLRSFGEGFYTIGSAGHEGNAAVAAALRPGDPALLHYRSGAFYCLRAAQAAGEVAFPGPEGETDASTPGAQAAPPEAAPAGPEAEPTPSDAEGTPPAAGTPAEVEAGAEAGTGGEAADGTAGGPAAGRDGAAGRADAYAGAARDVLRGMVASAWEPIAGGRHKVFGRADLAIVPTTSTIASHLPRAVGAGLALERLRRRDPAGRRAGADPLGDVGQPPRSPWPPDAIVVCSFGDASVNHASATAAFNTAGWYDHTGLRIPVLFVCEDNGLGISVRSPKGWVEATLRSKPGIRYFSADGTDPVQAYEAAVEAAGWVRRHRRPAVLHLSTVRLMGHAGADAEAAYRSSGEIAADLDRDPLLATARLLVAAGVATTDELLARYDERGWQVRRIAEEVLGEPKLASAAEVVAETAPRRPARVARAVADAATRAGGPGAAARADVFGGRLPEAAGPLTLAQTINAALADGMLDHPGMVVFGEDVAARGGVYGVTKGLRDRYGAARVFDTLLDETSILGLGLGAGLAGLLPVPEIQYLAYLHNAEDQLRGEAATMRFFSSGAFRNPMVVRVPGLAYQEGFGGHFHNDNSLAVLRDVPGLVIAVPARPDDAAAMVRTCLASAAVDGSVCVLVEPIALYHTRDLYTEGDGEWLADYAGPGAWAAGHAPVGRARVYGVGSAEDVTIVTFGNGVPMSLRAAATLADEGIGSRVVDLRWIAPLPVADIVREASVTGRVLVVDETRRSGGVGEGVLAALVDGGFVGAARRVASVDSFVPLGPAARAVLVTEDAITQGARTLLAR
ncbi:MULTISPECIES: transketolase C-terminal domain-containing protein [unclassified Micromonospora]|uniref:transketolase C-terminal domain-containing protein n=1 Tax=unclassified Micromonospora TaxID=2617518 RepID=UPI00098D597B|nr:MULTISPECIES: transketolase C-terminal domain-containing protein [unclassified Micromonospora]OON28947.1 transketolase [Micromonospora sp. Rc5]